MDFKRIELSDRELFEQCITKAGYQNTDASFAYWYAWAANERIYFAEDEMAIYITSRAGKQVFVAPYLKDFTASIAPAMEKLKSYMNEKGHGNILLYVPEKTKDKIERDWPGNMEFTLDRDASEYVYLSKDLITLSGKKYHSKRNHINAFLKDHEFEYAEYEDRYYEECLAIQKAWIADKDVPENEAKAETSAIERLLNHRQELGVIGCVIKMGGEVRAFSLASKISDTDADVHIEKCHPDYKALYPIVNREFVKNQLSGFTYINREEDMGDPGLRKAKLSYRPIRMNQRYRGEYK